MNMLVLYCYIMQKNSRNILPEHFLHTNHFQAKGRKRITNHLQRKITLIFYLPKFHVYLIYG